MASAVVIQPAPYAMPGRVLDRMCGMPCSVIRIVTSYAGAFAAGEVDAEAVTAGAPAAEDATTAIGLSRIRDARAARARVRFGCTAAT